MEEKIISILLDMQLDIRKIKDELQEVKKEQQEMKKEQQEMKKEQQEMKKEQQGMKLELQEVKKEHQGMKKEQKTMRELQDMTINKLNSIQEDVRINRLNIAKILEVQNKTLEFMKDKMYQNEVEHNEIRTRLSELEEKVM